MITPERVRQIHDEDSLFAFLSEELRWPFEDTPDTFEFYADELGLTPQETAQIESVRQIANFEAGQPFGIFLVKFSGEQVYKNALRRVLRGLSETGRNRDAALPAWKAPNLLFLCTANYRDWTIARFSGDTHTRATLSRFGWQREGDSGLRTLCQYNLEALKYPDNPADADAWRIQWAAAFDVEAATKRFYDCYETIFKEVEAGVQNVAGDKRLFTQRLFNRLMFIHFLSKKGWLKFNGRTDYLAALWQGRDPKENFYHAHLTPLFFAGLNNERAVDVNGNRAIEARIGEVPYLNGGLFARDEYDRADVFIDDKAFEAIIHKLFLPFNFTVEESTPLDVEVAVDPEMLGKVFEKLMTGPLRGGKGAFYTPRPVVTFMCREAIKGYLGQTPSDTPNETIPAERIAQLVDAGDDQAVSLAEAKRLLARLIKLRVVDPACGSGAYLLGMMQELFALSRLLDTRARREQARDDYDRKLSLIQNNLYGVDIDPFAVNIAMLRLWLSLIVDYREDDSQKLPPLPNLDFKIERGDSLLAPDPQGISDLFRRELIDNADALKQWKADYFMAAGAGKADLKDRITAGQSALIAALHQDLPPEAFEWRVQFAEVFKPEIATATIGNNLNLEQELAEADVPGGFHIVIANPPYGVKVSEATRQAYFPDAAQSKDTYGLFMARALQLLCEGGQFCYIVSDTWRTIKSHLPLRKMLLETATTHHIIDLPDWIFDATVNTGIVTLTKAKAPAGHQLIAGDLRGIERGDWSALENNLRIMAARGVDVQTPQYARYSYPQAQIADYENRSFFIASPKLYSLMSDSRFQRLGKTYRRTNGRKEWNNDGLCKIVAGIKTGENAEVLRRSHTSGRGTGFELVDPELVLSENEIGKLTQEEKALGIKSHERTYVPFDKGAASETKDGWLPNYFVRTTLYINWSQKSVDFMKAQPHSDLANIEFRFLKGLTYSPTGEYSPTFRLGCGGINGNKGSGIFFEDISPLPYLGLLTTPIAKYIMKSFLNHGVETGEEVLRAFPIPPAEQLNANEELTRLVEAIIAKQKAEPRYEYHLHEQREIDALVYELYGLDADAIREVELWYCRRYARLARAQGVWDEVHARYAAYLERAALLLAKPPGHWHSHPVYALIAQGEGPALDFKQFFSVDIYGADSKKSVDSVMREIAAFSNADGGAILLGVTNAGAVTGIESELPRVNHQDADGLEQKIRQCMERDLSPLPAGIAVRFETLPEGTVGVIEVPPALGVTYYHNEVYLRDGNRSLLLTGKNLVDWTVRRRG